EPGTNSLKCSQCGTVNQIGAGPVKVEETDFNKFLGDHVISGHDKLEIITVKCSSCGAESSLKPNLTSDNCPFCDSPLVIKGGTTNSVLKPKYLLPFAVTQKDAYADFGKWLKGLWFAPNNLKNYADKAEKLNGIYIPYWTYDSDTSSSYTGLRGDNYTVEEQYTTTENGQDVTRTQTVTKIRWSPVSGSLAQRFDDVLVLASKSLPEAYAYALNPWDLTHLDGFKEDYLAGFRTEIYQVDVKEGFGKAKSLMDVEIRKLVCRDIGGDEQKIETLESNFNDITFKHILLPIWLSAYRYNNKVYHFMINGRTGQVRGERPYSWVKIGFAIAAGIALIAIIIALCQ
ncbi:MAG TPA: hypothetical protein VG603_01935, partial [Chitinophagales bacterium]|nr:hypothetical protein [Chitinophagales bacterium]